MAFIKKTVGLVEKRILARRWQVCKQVDPCGSSLNFLKVYKQNHNKNSNITTDCLFKRKKPASEEIAQISYSFSLMYKIQEMET